MKDNVLAALNQQINMEMGAFTTYLSMAAYFESEALPGFSAWMRHHAEEEMVHALKIYDFIHRRRGRVTLQALVAPETKWANPTAAFEDALHHEQLVTASINQLLDLAHQERDHATSSFLQWFVDEQVEEEELVDAALQKIKRIGDYGPGLYMLDRELAQGSEETAAAEGDSAS